MKKIWFGVLCFMVGSIGLAIAQTAGSDRAKVGNDFSAALAGSDTYLQSIVANYDGGTTVPACAKFQFGINTMCWCDNQAYMINAASATPTGIDGGVMRLQEMVPVDAREKYGFGLLGNNKPYLCAWWPAGTSDGGTQVGCNCFRRY